MKHTFQCGIVGTSHDSLGDQFLAGMMNDPTENDARELARLRAAVAQHESQMKRAARVIAVLVKKAGGSVDITDMEEAEAHDLIVYRDDSARRQVLKVISK
jgi:hypothetical protein